MKYILIDEQRRNNAIEYIKKIDIKKPIEVLIRKYKKNRSLAQNNTYWMWIADIAPELGYTDNELHELFKVQFLGVEKRIVYNIELVIPKSTTDLEPPEMALFLNKIEMLAHSLNIKLRRPDDYNIAMGYRE